MNTLVLLAVSFGTAVMLTGLLRTAALHIGFLDKPVARSSHSIPTPIGGGLALVLPVFVASTFIFYAGQLEKGLFLSLFGAYAVAIVGLIDDLKNVHAMWRIPLHFGAALWSLFWLGEVPALDFGFFTLLNQSVLFVLALVALVWLTNLFNFMDGIDGLAGAELLFVTGFSLVTGISGIESGGSVLFTVACASAAGFLVWNWHPARIFMGDVGSSFAGFFIGLMALFTVQAGVMTYWTWLILLATFAVDATLTLACRFWRGDRWFEGHNTHAYQHAARKFQSHRKVTIATILVNLCWLTPLAIASVLYPSLGGLFSLIAVAPLAMLTVGLGAGRP